MSDRVDQVAGGSARTWNAGSPISSIASGAPFFALGAIATTESDPTRIVNTQYAHLPSSGPIGGMPGQVSQTAATRVLLT